MDPKVQALDTSKSCNQRRFAEISQRQEVNPLGWSRKFMSLHEMLEFRPTRLLYGHPIPVAKIFVSVSPGKYRGHLSVVEARQYDGQSKLAALTAHALTQHDTAKLAEFLGTDFRQHLGEFSCIDPPQQLATQSKQDKLSLTLNPRNKELQLCSRLMFSRGKCDPQQAIRPEAVLIAVDPQYRPVFVHPESLLRHTCKTAFERYVAVHDDKSMPWWWYQGREDLKLAPREPHDYKSCDNASEISVGAPPRTLARDRTEMPAVPRVFTAKDRLSILHKRPIVL